MFLIGDVSARDVQVAFVNPGAENGSDVWQPVTRFMAVAAEQFGLKLEVLYANRDRIRMVELARDVAARRHPRPSARHVPIPLHGHAQVGKRLLDALGQ